MTSQSRLKWAVAALATTTLIVTGCSSSSSGASGGASAGQQLVGTFKLAPGACGDATPTGSYFRMISPGGTIEHGKYFENPDSNCSDQSITTISGGTAGGFITGAYQPNPTPPFDGSGNALAAAISKPRTFTAIAFAISTNPKDPQSGHAVPAPAIFNDNGRLSGQLTAWSAAWNHQYFNQGSPKPDGSRPGLTAPVTGTYDAATGSFVLTWASEVIGGPFNGFSGYWHLQGTFVPGKS